MASSPSPSGSSPDAPSDDAAPSRLRRWGRRALWTLGGLVGAVLLLIGVALLVLQTETGATAAAQFLAQRANPFPNSELTVESASGNWVRSIRLRNVALAKTDTVSGSQQLAHIDTVAVQYSLGALLRGRVHIGRVAAASPTVTMRQAADSTWDLAEVLPEPSDDTTTGLPVHIDEIRLTRGQLAAHFYAEDRDSTARVDDLELRAQAVEVSPNIAGRLDTLGLRGHLPADTASVRLGVQAELSSNALRLDTLLLASSRSRMWGSGTARLPIDTTDSLDDVGLSLHASPLVLGDLTPIVPTLDVDPEEAIELDAQLSGSSEQLTLEADAGFSGGGEITLKASATPRTTATPDDPLRYELSSQIRSLTTSLLGPPDASENAISGSIDASLNGPELAALDGTIDAEFSDTRLYGVRASDVRLASSVTDGMTDIDLQGAFNGTSVSMEGTARPFDEAPSMDLTTQVRDLSLGTVAPDAGVEGSLTATARIRGQAMMTDAATYDVITTIGPSRVGTQQIEKGKFTLGWDAPTARFDGTLTFPTGGLRASGQAELDGSERFALETAALENVNVAALVGDTTASRVTATMRAEGQGFAPDSMQTEAELAVEEARYGPHVLESLSATVRLNEGQLTSKTTGRLNGGDWTVAVSGRPFATEPALELTRGRFQHLDIGPFLQDTTQSSRLHGTLQGQMHGDSLATMQLDVGLTLDTSRVNRQQITEAALDLALRNGRLSSSFDLNTPDGGADLSVEGRPFDDVPTYRIPQGSFERLNVGALAGMPNFQTHLSGNLSLEAEGSDLAELSVTSDVTLQNSTINQGEVSEGRLNITSGQEQIALDGQFSVTDGNLQLQGRLDQAEDVPSYTLRTAAQSLDIGALAGMDTLQAQVDSLRWTIDGQGTSLDSIAATTRFAATSIRLDRAQIDSLRLAGQLEQGVLMVDTLSIQSDAIEGAGQGPIALTQGAGASNFNLKATVTNVSALRRLVGADLLRLREGTLDAHVYGAASQQRFDGRASLDGLIYNDLRLAEAEISFNGQRGTNQLLDRLEVEGTAGYLSLPSFAVTHSKLNARYDGTQVSLKTTVEMDQQRHFTLGATFQPDTSPLTIHIQQLDWQLGPNQWSLAQETTVSIGDDYRIDQLRLERGTRQITADGVISQTGAQDLSVSIEGLQLGGVAPLLGLGGLDGSMNGRFSVTGAATSPVVDGQINLDLRSEGDNVGTLDLKVGYEDLMVSLDARLTHSEGGTLTGSGQVPMDLRIQRPTSVDISSRSVQIDASTEKFPINWVDPFLDPETVRSVTGTLVADVSIRGTMGQPDLSGTVSVADAGAYIPTLETEYRNGAITLALANDQIALKNAVIRTTNGGSLTAEGAIDFPELTLGEYNLSLEASNLLAIDTRAYRRAVVDGSIRLSGTTSSPVLSGDVRLEGGSIYFSEVLAETSGAGTEVILSPEDQLVLEERFGVRLTSADTTTVDFYDASSLDLSIQIQRDVWLRSSSNPEMNVQFSGTLDLQKAPEEDPQVFGTIDVIEGQSTVRQFGQQFEITEGSLTFNGDPTAPQLNLTALYEQRARNAQGSEVQITLSLSGRPDDLSPSLSSDPSMTTRNILSYLATGRPADNLFGGGREGGGGGLATQMALGQASNFVENLAASELGLDVVRLDVRTEGVSYLTVGRYLTPRFFASVEQPVVLGSAESSSPTTAFIPDITLEYQITDYLLLRSLSGQQTFQTNLLLEYSY